MRIAETKGIMADSAARRMDSGFMVKERRIAEMWIEGELRGITAVEGGSGGVAERPLCPEVPNLQRTRRNWM